MFLSRQSVRDDDRSIFATMTSTLVM